MDRAEKTENIELWSKAFAGAGVIVVARYQGMTVAQMTKVRRGMRDANASFNVIKNRLAIRALSGTPYEALAPMLRGPTAIGVSADPVAAPKLLTKFAKENDKLVIIGGMLESQVLDEKGVKALADLPPLDQIRAQFLGLLSTPATRIATILNQPGTSVARVLKAYAEKDAA